jgi:Predicted membrane protein
VVVDGLLSSRRTPFFRPGCLRGKRSSWRRSPPGRSGSGSTSSSGASANPRTRATPGSARSTGRSATGGSASSRSSSSRGARRRHLRAAPARGRRRRPDPVSITDLLGLALFAAGFGIEAVADAQLARYRQARASGGPGAPGPVLDTGLWRYSRHPNYFGEALLWWGFWLFALDAPWGWATVFAPALMTFLLVKVSGVAMLDAHMTANRPEYAGYMRRTSGFLVPAARAERRVTQAPAPADSGLVLLTGATGYVGGRLLRALAARGRRVRCLARRPEALASHVPSGTEVVAGDCLKRETLDPALAGVHAAYYLVHSMAAGAAFEEQDRLAARNFGEAARAAGVRKIVYLGGLGEAGEGLSAHLRSRQETGEVLRSSSGLPVVELRASVVLGSGSLSFELIRSLVERLPAMICPRWVETKAQPIAIEDLVAYLLAALDVDPGEGLTVEIGGADQVTYGDLMREYARQRA